MGFFDTIGQIIGTSDAPQVAPLAYQSQQQELIDRLRARANGTTPSLAAFATNANQGNALNNTMAQLNSSSGLNPALQARLAAQAGQQNQSDIAQQGTAAQMQEQQQADQALGNQILGAQGSSLAQSTADVNAQNAQANRLAGLLGAGGQAAVAFANKPSAPSDPSGTSDRNAKEDIESSDGSARDFIDHLKGKLYEYKDKADGEGVHVGIMAQDLEKSPLGKPMVFEEGGVKKIDYGKGFGALLGAVAEINDKLKELESKKG